MKILVVEDDKTILDFVVQGLREAGFAVDFATDGESGLTFALNGSYDAAVIDIMLPQLDGLSLISELRRQKIKTPVIILSAKHSVEDRVRGLETGSDDYLVKPFAFSELLARIQALIRRTMPRDEPSKLEAADLSMDLLRREVTRSDKKIELQPKEFALLEYLLRNRGRVMSKTLILEHIWDFSFNPQTNVVDVLVCRLRNKIDKGFAPKLIHTIRGIGYVLKED
jgi:heavy metal response regulator